jgi:hypothetical protein
MLETTLATEFEPGTNIKGGVVAGASWAFALPSLELERVVCLGPPPEATLRTLAELGRRVLIICTRRRQLASLRGELAGSGHRNVALVLARNDALPLATSCADLVVVPGRGRPRGRRGGLRGRRGGPRGRHGGAATEVARVLAPDGSAYLEGTRRVAGSGQALGGEHEPRVLRLTPLLGEARTAVPEADREVLDYFARHGLEAFSFKKRPLRRLATRLAHRPLLGRVTERRGLLIGRAAREAAVHPPHYLTSIARQAGVGLEGYRFGLSAPGNYSSRKVVLFLFGPGKGSPELIVKLTRSPELNHRLENEYRALKALAGLHAVPEGFPRPLFAGHHAGLAIVGESALEGVPLASRTDGSPACPYGLAAVRWLTELGAATANPRIASSAEVADALDELLRRFVQIYRPTAPRQAFLAHQIAEVARASEDFPLVFQHGDPGIWNLLATPEQGVGFLDWEAYEPRGMPLWDLFYFLRSYCVSGAEAVAPRDRLQRFSRHFVEESPHGILLAESTRRYCESVGLAPRFVKPLFFTCWMHRALKESTRLPASRLSSGHYLRLLELCIDARDARPLRRLLLD